LASLVYSKACELDTTSFDTIRYVVFEFFLNGIRDSIPRVDPKERVKRQGYLDYLEELKTRICDEPERKVSFDLKQAHLLDKTLGDYEPSLYSKLFKQMFNDGLEHNLTYRRKLLKFAVEEIGAWNIDRVIQVIKSEGIDFDEYGNTRQSQHAKRILTIVKTEKVYVEKTIEEYLQRFNRD